MSDRAFWMLMTGVSLMNFVIWLPLYRRYRRKLELLVLVASAVLLGMAIWHRGGR